MHTSITVREQDDLRRRHLLAAQEEYVRAVADLDMRAIDDLVLRILDVQRRGRTVFVCGNGGSASTATHMVCDLIKTAQIAGVAPIRALALGDNAALLTAWANDASFEHTFAEPLRAYAAPGDLLVVVSVSGNSPNVVAALRTARAIGVETVALTGCDGGQARTLADGNIHVPSPHYGVVEATHAVVQHMVVFALKDLLSGSATS